MNKILYYGVRGSIPVSGKEYHKYGGDTTSVYIFYQGKHILIDAGSGIRRLGKDLVSFSSSLEIYLLFTHYHWDHIQGLPFFLPLFSPQNTIYLYGTPKKDHKGNLWDLPKILNTQQERVYFPILLRETPSKKEFFHFSPGEDISFPFLKIKTLPLEHPGGAVAFKFFFDSFTYVFSSDVEHTPSMIEELILFSQGADILAYDAQYTPQEYEKRVGWGHSTYEMGAYIAKEARIKELHLVHHDPFHTDPLLEEIEEKAKKIFPNTRLVFQNMEVRF